MLAVIGLLLLSSGPARAWSEWGHKAVARIAYDRAAPPVQHWVDTVLAEHPDPACHQLEEAAVWPDRVRRERPETRPWHYIDLAVGSMAAGHHPDPQNVVWAILEMRQRVARESAAPKAEALAFLIHFVADVHQPLHACCLYNEEFPEGDGGGNKIGLSHRWGGNLHHFWDEGGARHPEDLPGIERELVKAHPPQAEQDAIQEPMRWAEETHPFGAAAYSDLDWQKLPELGDSYVHRAQVVSDERLAVAAYRLCTTLTNLYRQSLR